MKIDVHVHFMYDVHDDEERREGGCKISLFHVPQVHVGLYQVCVFSQLMNVICEQGMCYVESALKYSYE